MFQCRKLRCWSLRPQSPTTQSTCKRVNCKKNLAVNALSRKYFERTSKKYYKRTFPVHAIHSCNSPSELRKHCPKFTFQKVLRKNLEKSTIKEHLNPFPYGNGARILEKIVKNVYFLLLCTTRPPKLHNLFFCVFVI